MLDRYFLALLPDFSSNSLGVIHSSPTNMHLPFEPDSYLLAYKRAVTALHRTCMMDPILDKFF